MNVRERFHSKYVRSEAGCWLWQGHLDRKGRGNLRVGKRRLIASRPSYELHFDAIPEGLFVCHECDNPQCVNPDHLWLGTHRDNTDDMIAKGRNYRCARPASGELNPKAKLNATVVAEIRRRCAAGEGQSAVAREYGIRPSAVWGIVNGRTWASAASPTQTSAPINPTDGGAEK